MSGITFLDTVYVPTYAISCIRFNVFWCRLWLVSIIIEQSLKACNDIIQFTLWICLVFVKL